MARKIEVVDYRPEWADMYKREAKKIRSILGKNCKAVYHIGSTSVKGVPAKPIIAIMPDLTGKRSPRPSRGRPGA